VACWSTEPAISLKRVKLEEKLIWQAYRNSPTLFRMVPSATPLSPKIGVRTLPKIPIAIISGTGKAANLKFGQYIQRVHPNKSPLKLLEKREHGCIQGLPKCFGYPPIIPGTGKATEFKFGQYIQRVNPSKTHKKFWRKGGVGICRDCPNILGTPYYLRNRKNYRVQIWRVHSEGPSEQKPIKNLEKRGRGRIQGLPNFFG